MKIHKKNISVYVLCLAMFLACFMNACSRRPTSTADVPRLMPASYKITVAPFTQPLDPAQLIAGQIPESQGRISQDALILLDGDLRSVLQKDTNRTYSFIPRRNLPKDWSVARSVGQPDALNRWIAYGREHGADYLLVPQVLDWHEREGSEAGVTSSAHVRAEFFLLGINRDPLANGVADKVVNRSIFEEKQVGLIDNLLSVGDFVKRKGQWITARDLTVEAMRKAVKDLGL